jgi:hypothetical protein
MLSGIFKGIFETFKMQTSPIYAQIECFKDFFYSELIASSDSTQCAF